MKNQLRINNYKLKELKEKMLIYISILIIVFVKLSAQESLPQESLPQESLTQESLTQGSLTQDFYMEKYNIGVGGGYNFLDDNARFQQVPGIPNCCSEFNGGSGNGINIFVGYSRYIFSGLFASGRVNFLLSDIEFSTIEDTYVNYNDSTVPGKFEHFMQISTLVLSIEPGLSYNLWDRLDLGISVPFGFFIDKRFLQKETIIEPQDAGTFLDSNGENTGERIRNDFSGNLPLGNRLLSMLELNLSYDFPLNRSQTVFIKPAISFKLGLNDFLSEFNWTRNSISLEISILYKNIQMNEPDYDEEITPVPDKEIIISDNRTIPDKRVNDPIDSNKKNFDLSYLEISKESLVKQSSFVDQNEEFALNFDTTDIVRKEVIKQSFNKIDTIVVFTGNIIDKHDTGDTKNSDRVNDPNVILIRKKNADFSVPLLNYIFFDDNSAEIPLRYITKRVKDPNENNKQVISNRTSSTDKIMLKTYYNILNIIGKRLQEFPQYDIHLTSYSPAHEDSVGLGLQRGENIQKYLVNNFKISPEKIKIRRVNDPTFGKVNDPNDKFPFVKIESDEPEILRPVTVEDTIIEFTASKAAFEPGTNQYDVPDVWTFTLMNQDILYKKITGKKRLPATIEWNLANSDMSGFNMDKPFYFGWSKVIDPVRVNDPNENNKNVEISKGSFVFKVDREGNSLTEGKEKHYVYYVKFDYNSYKLDEEAKQIIEQAKEKIGRVIDPRDSKGSLTQIYINGYTDNIGNYNYNLELSKMRAKAVFEELGVTEALVKGFGNKKQNTEFILPEEQFYSRMVEIIIKGH